ncbi:hypothetical protein QJQ45_018876 [Haematococcus lacustris]|nr:hypothetical protein QJQ45_018876 [Haematococcus lacustris]
MPIAAAQLKTCKVLHAWSAAVSPHKAVEAEGRQVADADIQASVAAELQAFASQTRLQAAAAGEQGGLVWDAGAHTACLTLVETAGGVASPAPSGNLMVSCKRCGREGRGLWAAGTEDRGLYQVCGHNTLPIYLPVCLLHCPPGPLLNGTEAPGPSQAEAPGLPQRLGNATAVQQHLQQASIHRLGSAPALVLDLPGCPAPPAETTQQQISSEAGGVEGGRRREVEALMQAGLDASLAQWLQDTAPAFDSLLTSLQDRHHCRLAELRGSASRGATCLWWPFTQHTSLGPGSIQVVDSRSGEEWQTLQPPQLQPAHPHPANSTPLGTATAPTASSASCAQPEELGPLYDACCSWWTQLQLQMPAAAAVRAVVAGGCAADDEDEDKAVATAVASSQPDVAVLLQGATAEVQPELSRAVAYAAGRYLHVLSPQNVHQYAEANGMLSKNQAGFRSHRNTTQQLQMLVMALEDAKLAKADIYALLVDFTSAFNTTCQDKLLWIMHDLGFPTDAMDAVKDLYTGVTTRFKTPYGHTDPVPVNRGTIQGDSLSPFLFLIYIEPLLRWLQVGARGYKFKSATADSGERATVSSIDYADDIAILCNTLRNLRCQADKLSAFSDWGHLIISHSKTLATAALHHSVETGMCSSAAEADKRARQQLQTVSLQGKPVTYHRPTSPFTYLGVLITMTLDWKPQHTAMITQLRQKLERLRRSFASARQAIHIIRTAIIPSLAYSFCAVPCTPGDLELYDRSINQCVKLKLRLPLGTPNAIIREDADKLGIGISSTAQEYHARNTTALTHSLQSTDVAHAHISRSMLHKQITWLNTQASTQGHRMLTLLHHTLRARQLVYASISGLSATEEGLPLYHEECQTLGRLITQASSSQAHDVVSASITCLKSLGITHASELSCKDNTHIITGSMLTSKYGKKVKQKHIIALNKLAAMAAQPSCPDATATRAIRDSRNTSLDLPPDQRKITTWAAGLTELAPTPAVPDTRTRYMDMKAFAVMHATQPATADRAAAAPAVHDATRTSSRLLKREQRATQSAPTKPTPPKAGTKRNNEGRQTQTIPQDIVRIIGLDLPGLSSWKVDKACRCKPKNLGCILGAMYGHQEAITSIDGWQWDGINKENYYKVHWKPTVIDRWALPLCAEEGYTPTHIETISREEAKDVCTCELCWLPRGDSPTCHNCKRAYHPACLEEAHLSGHKEPGYWLCPVCKFGSNDFKTTMRQSAHSDLIRVHWHPTLEPAPLITAHLDYMAKRNDYDEENRQIQEARHARPDTHLPAHTRQGLPDPHTWLPRCTNLHSKATFHTYPINPQTDIVGTGNCETFLQLHPHMTAPAMSLSTGEPIMPRHDLVQHVTVHDESGRTVGLLTKDQHQHLHAWLQHTPHTRNLATEVVALLRRQDAQSSHHPMRGAQDKVLNTLHATRSFPSTVQRWADPLTVRPETTTYWSPDINDTAFGAHHNCLLVRHTGLSTWNVPADDAVALKCVNHAIHSATQEEAMATIMLIPGKKGISYPKHIDTLRRYPEYCQHLASIPPTKTRCSKPGKHANLHIYVIWNAAGQQLVTKGNPQGWLASTATALHPQRDTHPIRNRPTNQSQPATPPSGHKQHMRLPLDKDLPTSGHQRGHQQLTHHSTTQPRMAITEWATIAYTDGSCIKTSGAAPASVGAGVYIPENNVLITAALNDPASNTINRAELTAIHAALKAGAKRIATDSLCSLYQIRRALANPMSLITHKHNDILTAIATLIIDSPATIHFYKVRAHSGIIGNEGADALAKHAALHPELANTPAYSPTTRNETKNWLSNAADGDSPAPLPDCRHSVRAHMHRKHKLGLANQDSIYYQMTQEIRKVAATGAGERVMADTNISTPAQRTALLYRTGGLYNQKLAMRWKRATDDRCPLCGEADSATHLLSGCSETLPMVQERHNGAGRLITKAISKGTLGGYISFADTGSWEKGAKESLDLPSDTLHTTLQTLGLKPEDTKHTTRPDILMVAPHKKASKDGEDTKRGQGGRAPAPGHPGSTLTACHTSSAPLPLASLLALLRCPDDGSTAIEVALKMAFRKFMVDKGLASGSTATAAVQLQVVGLQDAYHGDTLGAMDCVAPSVFNAPLQAPWYRGRGLFLQAPNLGMVRGRWQLVSRPAWLAQGGGQGEAGGEGAQWDSLEEEEEEDYAGIHRRALREEQPPGARPAPTIKLEKEVKVFSSSLLPAAGVRESDASAQGSFADGFGDEAASSVVPFLHEWQGLAAAREQRCVFSKGISAFVADDARVGPDLVELGRDGAVDDEGGDVRQDVVVSMIDEGHRREAEVLFVATGEGGWLFLIVWSAKERVCLPVRVEGSGSASQPSLGVAFGADSLEEVVSPTRDDSQLTLRYRINWSGRRQYIEQQLDEHQASSPPGSHMAALIIEPLVQGAGGMLLLDPQFQRQMVQVRNCRSLGLNHREGEVVGRASVGDGAVCAQACRARGMAIIFDEVMTGLYRVGSVAAGAWLREQPDIACFAKLMTAGLVPMAATLATDAVFHSFDGDSKMQALLHGHSYTAYPIGCATTVAALELLTSPSLNRNLCTPQGDSPTCPSPDKCRGPCGKLVSLWDAGLVSKLSHHSLVSHVVCCGSLLAVQLQVAAKAPSNGGAQHAVNYTSLAGASVQLARHLRDVHGVYARPLGEVVYLMVPPTTSPSRCSALQQALIGVLDDMRDAPEGTRMQQCEGDGVIV